MRRTLADLWVWLWQAAIVGAFALAVLDGWVPSQHLPWRPLDLDRPPGLATPAKVAALEARAPEQTEARTERCMAVLRQAGVEVERVPDLDDGAFCVVRGAVRITGGDVTPLAPSGLVMRCPMAVRYVFWDRQGLRPAARELLGAEPRRVEAAGSYACRRIYGATSRTERPSEHARANALDLTAVALADGRRVTVARDWGAINPNSRAARLEREARLGSPEPNGGAPEGAEAPASPEQQFLRRIRDDACGLFGTVLSPEYNAAHRDHLHFDGASFGVCN